MFVGKPEGKRRHRDGNIDESIILKMTQEIKLGFQLSQDMIQRDVF